MADQAMQADVDDAAVAWASTRFALSGVAPAAIPAADLLNLATLPAHAAALPAVQAARCREGGRGGGRARPYDRGLRIGRTA